MKFKHFVVVLALAMFTVLMLLLSRIEFNLLSQIEFNPMWKIAPPFTYTIPPFIDCSALKNGTDATDLEKSWMFTWWMMQKLWILLYFASFLSSATISDTNHRGRKNSGAIYRTKIVTPSATSFNFRPVLQAINQISPPHTRY